MEIDHIGYLSRSIEKSLEQFSVLGFVPDSDTVEDICTGDYAGRDIRICFIRNDNIKIELVQPANKAAPVYTLLKKTGEGPYHICYRVENIESSMQELTRRGWMTVSSPAPAVAFEYARVAFLFNKGVGLIELLETGNPKERSVTIGECAKGT